ncbi:hypothetical protein KQH41_01150 [bacterium]|nr:hypothetical protein [bacterium]
MNSGQRFLRALRREVVDRTPVVIPGGMMAGSLYALLRRDTLAYPDIHLEPGPMAAYAVQLQKTCNLDNYGLPFCMTIEAEDFGATINLGNPWTEPRVTHYPAKTLAEVLTLNPIPCRRHQITLEAIARLAHDQVPVVGNIIGPTSLLTSLLEPSVVYRAMEKDGAMVARVFDHLSHHLINFANAQLAAGAAVITIADPGSSGEIIGGTYFEQFVSPVIRSIVGELKSHNALVVLHICGNIMALVDTLATLPWDALSVDSVVSLAKLQSRFPGRTLMGNVSTHLLAVSEEATVYKAARQAVEVAAILAPACGLSTRTLPENIRSMVHAAEDAARRIAPRPGTDD